MDKFYDTGNESIMHSKLTETGKEEEKDNQST